MECLLVLLLGLVFTVNGAEFRCSKIIAAANGEANCCITPAGKKCCFTPSGNQLGCYDDSHESTAVSARFPNQGRSASASEGVSASARKVPAQVSENKRQAPGDVAGRPPGGGLVNIIGRPFVEGSRKMMNSTINQGILLSSAVPQIVDAGGQAIISTKQAIGTGAHKIASQGVDIVTGTVKNIADFAAGLLRPVPAVGSLASDGASLVGASMDTANSAAKGVIGLSQGMMDGTLGMASLGLTLGTGLATNLATNTLETGRSFANALLDSNTRGLDAVDKAAHSSLATVGGFIAKQG